MINAFIRSMLGTWGNAELDFLIRNNVWISALVLLYAVLIFLGRTSYQRSLQYLFNWYREEHGGKVRSKSKSNIIKLIESGEIPWNSISKAYWFPLITPPKRFIFYIKNQQTLQRIFNKETLVNIFRTREDRNG
jgi:hypothetical protein